MKWLPWVVALCLLLAWGHERQESGKRSERIAQLEHRKAQVDTVYTTLTKTRSIVRVKTDSILRTDTLWRSDTVRVLIAAERKACDAVIQTCEQRVAVRDSIIKQLKKKPSVFSKLPWLLGGYLIHEVTD